MIRNHYRFSQSRASVAEFLASVVSVSISSLTMAYNVWNFCTFWFIFRRNFFNSFKITTHHNIDNKLTFIFPLTSAFNGANIGLLNLPKYRRMSTGKKEMIKTYPQGQNNPHMLQEKVPIVVLRKTKYQKWKI